MCDPDSLLDLGEAPYDFQVKSTPQDVTSTQVYPGHTLRQVHIIPGRGLYSSSGFTVTSVSWPTPGNAATNSTTNSPSSEYLNSTSWLSKGTQEITTLLGGEDEAAYASPYLTALVVQALQVLPMTDEYSTSTLPSYFSLLHAIDTLYNQNNRHLLIPEITTTRDTTPSWFPKFLDALRPVIDMRVAFVIAIGTKHRAMAHINADEIYKAVITKYQPILQDKCNVLRNVVWGEATADRKEEETTQGNLGKDVQGETGGGYNDSSKNIQGKHVMALNAPEYVWTEPWTQLLLHKYIYNSPATSEKSPGLDHTLRQLQGIIREIEKSNVEMDEGIIEYVKMLTRKRAKRIQETGSADQRPGEVRVCWRTFTPLLLAESTDEKVAPIIRETSSSTTATSSGVCIVDIPYLSQKSYSQALSSSPDTSHSTSSPSTTLITPSCDSSTSTSPFFRRSSLPVLRHFSLSAISIATNEIIGDVGYSMWPGSLLLAEWAAVNLSRFNNVHKYITGGDNLPRHKTIVELGAGVGFTAVAIAYMLNHYQYDTYICHTNDGTRDMNDHSTNHNSPRGDESGTKRNRGGIRYIATDMNWGILNILYKNLYYNGIPTKDAETCAESSPKPNRNSNCYPNDGSEVNNNGNEGKETVGHNDNTSGNDEEDTLSLSGSTAIRSAMCDWMTEIATVTQRAMVSPDSNLIAGTNLNSSPCLNSSPSASCIVECHPLDWTAPSLSLFAEWSPMTILSADCVYSPDLIDPHLECIKLLLQAGKRNNVSNGPQSASPTDPLVHTPSASLTEPACFMAFQLRNPTTYASLIAAFPQHGLQYELIPLISSPKNDNICEISVKSTVIPHRFAQYYNRDLMKLLKITLIVE